MVTLATFTKPPRRVYTTGIAGGNDAGIEDVERMKRAELAHLPAVNDGGGAIQVVPVRPHALCHGVHSAVAQPLRLTTPHFSTLRTTFVVPLLILQPMNLPS
jgi:hypothetical protein